MGVRSARVKSTVGEMAMCIRVANAAPTRYWRKSQVAVPEYI